MSQLKKSEPIPTITSGVLNIPPAATRSSSTPTPMLNTGNKGSGKVIVQYYAFLDNGLYDEAYQLLSSSQQKSQKQEEFEKMAALAYKNVDFVSMQPYAVWAKQNGYSYAEDNQEPDYYHVQIISEGVGGMSGSIVNGQIQTLFITLKQENNEWKIRSFSTAPFRDNLRLRTLISISR